MIFAELLSSPRRILVCNIYLTLGILLLLSSTNDGCYCHGFILTPMRVNEISKRRKRRSSNSSKLIPNCLQSPPISSSSSFLSSLLLSTSFEVDFMNSKTNKNTLGWMSRANLASSTTRLYASKTTTTKPSSSSPPSSTPPLLYDATLCDETFHQLYQGYLPEWLISKCDELGWTHPTLIQKRSLDTFFGISSDEDDDDDAVESSVHSMVIQAQTGSGKTLTYLLPVLSQLEPRAAIQAMIVVPTRELGLQVATVAKRLLAGQSYDASSSSPSPINDDETKYDEISDGNTNEQKTSDDVQQQQKQQQQQQRRKYLVMSLLQGSQLKRQRAWAWAETPQIVIGTPSELLNMVKYGGLPRINAIRYVVVDEVDACLVHNSGAGLSSTASSDTATVVNAHTPGANVRVDKTLASSLNMLLSKYLSPTYYNENDEDFRCYRAEDDVQRKLMMLGGGSSSGMTKRKSDPSRRTKYRQTIFCSATIPQHRHFLKQCKENQWTLDEPIFVCTSPGEALPPTLEHAYMVCQSKEKKVATLRRILSKLYSNNSNNNNSQKAVSSPSSSSATDTTERTSIMSKNKKVLVFCDPTRPMEEMAKAIAHDLGGIYFVPNNGSNKRNNNDNHHEKEQVLVSVLRYDDSLSERAGSTNAFASTTLAGNDASSTEDDDNDTDTDTDTNFRVMLTGDLAARGLDLQGITHVIHFDLPTDADTYLHRSGRAGRLGKRGQVLSIITPDQEFVLHRIANALHMDDGKNELKCIGRQKGATKKKKKKSSQQHNDASSISV